MVLLGALKDRLLDTLAAFARRLAQRRERRPAGYSNLDDAAYQIYRTLSALNDPTHPADELIDDFAMQSSNKGSWDDEPDPRLVEMVEFAQRHLTPRHLAEVAASATWQEYCEAGEDFGILREMITIFNLPERLRSQKRLRRRKAELDPRLWTIMRDGALGMFGHWIIMGDIALRRAGYGQRIREYLTQGRAWLGEVDLGVLDKEMARRKRSGKPKVTEDSQG